MIWIDDEGNDEDEEEEEEEEEEDDDDDDDDAAAAADDDSDDDNDHYYSVGFANTKAQQLFSHELMQFCRREYSLCSGHAATCWGPKAVGRDVEFLKAIEVRKMPAKKRISDHTILYVMCMVWDSSF